jgi:hypothetical protein
MSILTWNAEAIALLEQYAKEHTQGSGKINWTDIPSVMPGRTPEAARTQWKRMRRVTGALQDIVAPEPDSDRPTHQEIFVYLRDQERSLKKIANHFNVSPKTIEEKIAAMDAGGYNVVIHENEFAVRTSTTPDANPQEVSIAELMGKSFCFAIASDIHAISKYAQPTALNQFIKYAYEEYGARHIMVPGDLTDGAFVYRGHLDEMIPQARPMDRTRVWMTAEAAVQTLDFYFPKYDGLTYFAMGGNHDRTLLTNSGMDPIRMICDRRADFHYGGYDKYSVRLTEKSYVRLVHPSGGVPYARSYKLQKGIENLAFEALRQAMLEDQPPMISVLVLAHYHLTSHSPEPPLHGILAGCFQGQTPYLVQKHLVPHIAGIIIEIKFDSLGKPQVFSHIPVYFNEIKDDWKNWPTPLVADPDLTPDNLGSMISVTGDPPKDLTEKVAKTKND